MLISNSLCILESKHCTNLRFMWTYVIDFWDILKFTKVEQCLVEFGGAKSADVDTINEIRREIGENSGCRKHNNCSFAITFKKLREITDINWDALFSDSGQFGGRNRGRWPRSLCLMMSCDFLVWELRRNTDRKCSDLKKFHLFFQLFWFYQLCCY